MKSIIALLMAFTLVGCASSPQQDFGKLNSVEGRYDHFATYIQFNEKYAITAKHVVNIQNGIKCSTKCDLVFFEKEAKNVLPAVKWREPVPGEKITIVGNSVGNITVKKTGTVLPNLIKPSADSEFFYYLNTAKSTDGMSGGPVYADSDGAIVGMTIGALNADVDGFKKDTSIFIPYQIIKKEWELISN